MTINEMENTPLTSPLTQKPKHRLLPSVISTIAATGLLLGGIHSQAAEEQHDFSALQQAGDQWDYFEDYCTECHNFDDYSGGVDFTSYFPEDVPGDAELFEKVLKKLRGRMMPPPNQSKPDGARTDQFVAWLESFLDESGTLELDPRTKAIHRLNRKEYANAIRDLFGLTINPTDILPEDDTSAGFDNIADALQVSPAFIGQYISAARQVAEQAIGNKIPSVGSIVYEPDEELPMRARGGGSQQQHIEGLPLGTRGGMLIEHWFPADGEYAISVGDFNLHLWMFNIEFENTMIVTIDGVKVYQTLLGGEADRTSLDLSEPGRMEDINSRTKDIRFTTTAGSHKVGVTFLRRTYAESDDRLQPFIPGTLQDRILSIPSVEVRGPFDPSGVSQTASRDLIFSCYPENSAAEQNCANEIINKFATRAYRRAVTAEEITPLIDFYQKGYQDGGFEEGIRLALTRTLASPNFLYRSEITPSGIEPGSIYQLSSLDLASRLSFFLWSSIPDDELLALAINDQLHDPQILEAQVKRMLKDDKAHALASNFAFQWLKLAKLDEISPDPAVFPYASGAGDLRPDFVKEIELFIASIFREDQSIMNLMDADYSYLNERLALHYGINSVKGNNFRRVDLADSRRWGLLGKGGVLMATAYPNRTSPVLRGSWILETIIGSPPPIPPPDVEDLAENELGQAATTVRERLELHRANPTCNACHSFMDPLGFALDNFDATGRWRDRDRFTGSVIDASGILPNGDPVNGPDDLRAALMSNPDLFAQALTEKLMIYALGRSLEAQDMPIVRGVVREAAADNYRFSAIIMNIVNSHLFQMQKVPELNAIAANNVALTRREP